MLETLNTYWYLPLDSYNQPNGLVNTIELTEADYLRIKKDYGYIYDKERDAERRAQD